MNKEFFLILLSVFLFVAVNTIFYFQILNRQLDFQTELISRQSQICGNTIEQEGQRFENELRSIPYQDDFTRLFTDEEIKARGSINLQKLYTGYSQLIDKITVYDNHHNVYSLILDPKNNFVSDYYESQRQTPLKERDQLIVSEDKYELTVPGFDDEGVVRSNILVELNYTRFVNDIFERYGLQDAIWQWLVSEDGELISTTKKDLLVPETDLKKIESGIEEGLEGAIVHTITIDSVATQVVSAYYPVWLVNRDLGIVFSIRTDLFLQSIVKKIIFISLCSLFLLAALLYIHFRVTKVQSTKIKAHKFSEDSLFNTIDILPFGLVFVNPDGSIRIMNQASRQMFLQDNETDVTRYSELGLDITPDSVNGSLYNRTFGEGVLLLVQNNSAVRHIYKMEWEAEVGEADSKIVLLIDISEFESFRNLERISELARAELLESMAREISVPVKQMQQLIAGGDKEELQKSFSMLTNLIDATLDFAGQDATSAVVEEIPYFLSSEIDLALEPFRSVDSPVSFITKIRNDVPDKLLGDPFRLRQAISKLVENASELTDEGRILVSCEMIEQHAGPLKLQFHIEDTGVGLDPEKIESIMNDLHRDRINLNTESDPLRRRFAIARRQVELLKGQLWIESPSTISTSPDKPGIKSSFTLDVFPAENLKDSLIFKEIQRLNEIECLVLSQEKETESGRFKPLSALGINVKYLVYREENLDSLYGLVKEKSSSLQMLVLVNSSTQDGFKLADGIIRDGLNENLILIVVSSVIKRENITISRNTGIDYYIEDPFESHHFAEIISKHFPGLDKEEVNKTPIIEEINPDISILLAEDNLFNRKLIQGLFKRLGLEIELAENGAQAVKMVKDGAFDLIFMDILMPEMDGLQAAAEIRKLGYKGPIIALTAVENGETRKAAQDAGFDDYIVKPAGVEQLRKIISKTSKTT